MSRFVASLVLTLAVLLPLPALAAGLPTARPEEVGLSSARLARIERTLRADVDKGRIPGAVVLVARKGRVGYLTSVGLRDPNSQAPMTPDAIFAIASMTKPMTSVAAMMLYEEGRLLVSDPVSKYLPAMGKMQVGVERTDATGKTTVHLVPVEREMTIQDLLRHTSGLTYNNRGTTAVHKLYPDTPAVRSAGPDEFIALLAKAPLRFQPGTKWEYSHATDVLGRVVEVVAGTTLGAFLQERVWTPLKMTDTAFRVPADKQARLARPFDKDPDTGKAPSIRDVTTPPKFECGGGCAVSTVADYSRFAQMLLNRGSLDGARILGRKTVEYMTTDHLGPEVVRGGDYSPGGGYGFGLGFAVRTSDGVANTNGSTGDFNWGGAYGTYFWVDPKEQLVVVSMTQAPGPIRVHYRQLIRGLVLQALD
ncbi:MAG TPA: serine hydrolase domain-containing protein [Methylomirabilota bacterium]|jgi:CubicO group peptidase (beta-lactamase class C family)